MYKNFRLKLFSVLLLLAFVIAFAISLIDYMRMRENIEESIQTQIEHATDRTINALQTIDKVLSLVDVDITSKMSLNTQFLLDLYEKNPDVTKWDYESLAEEIGMDIYIINENYVILFSNVLEEIGLDFKICCETLHKQLEERRESGNFYVDHIDIDQKNGELKKFSYMATPDKNYIIELGYNLKDERIFEQFDFTNVAQELIENSSFIKDIHILNFGGLIYGEKYGKTVSGERKESFERAISRLEVVEHRGTYDDEAVVFRYIPYVSTYDEGLTKLRVVEIIYSEKEFANYFSTNFYIFLIQFILVIVVTIFISSLLASWLAKPIYYAFHDGLTGLKNRAAFNELLKNELKSKQQSTALFILDLDNFKLVNDHLGHHEGDRLLQNIAEKIKRLTEDKGEAFRLGGDEFAIILQETAIGEVEQLAKKILNEINEVISDDKIYRFAVSVSIGISMASGKVSKEKLFLEADKAMYAAKQKGKNQYQIYHDSMEEVILPQ